MHTWCVCVRTRVCICVRARVCVCHHLLLILLFTLIFRAGVAAKFGSPSKKNLIFLPVPLRMSSFQIQVLQEQVSFWSEQEKELAAINFDITHINACLCRNISCYVPF